MKKLMINGDIEKNKHKGNANEMLLAHTIRKPIFILNSSYHFLYLNTIYVTGEQEYYKAFLRCIQLIIVFSLNGFPINSSHSFLE